MKIVHWFEGDLFFPQISGGSTHVESLIRGMPSYEHEVLVDNKLKSERIIDFSSNAKIIRFPSKKILPKVSPVPIIAAAYSILQIS